MVDPATLLGRRGAAPADVISGPFSREKAGRRVTLFVTSACIDCDLSRENCPAVYRHAERGQTEIVPEADFFEHLGEIVKAVDNCPTTALGLEVT